MAQLSLNIEGQNINAPKGIPKTLQGGSVKSTGIIQTSYNLLFTGAALLAVVFILFAGISFVTSRGDPTKLAESRKRLIYSIIGLVIVILSFAIVTTVMSVLGVDNKNTLLK